MKKEQACYVMVVAISKERNVIRIEAEKILKNIDVAIE
jgi:hypothetical protein